MIFTFQAWKLAPYLHSNFFKIQFTYGTKYSRMEQVKFFKPCLPQISLDPFLNTLPHIRFLGVAESVLPSELTQRKTLKK